MHASSGTSDSDFAHKISSSSFLNMEGSIPASKGCTFLVLLFLTLISLKKCLTSVFQESVSWTFVKPLENSLVLPQYLSVCVWALLYLSIRGTKFETLVRNQPGRFVHNWLTLCIALLDGCDGFYLFIFLNYYYYSFFFL